MLKFIIAILSVLSISFNASAQRKEQDPASVAEEINFKREPFWMIAYDKLETIRPAQKDYYLENVGPAIRNVQGLENISQEQLSDASTWYKDWEKIMRRVYKTCANKTLEKACNEVAKVRLETYQQYGLASGSQFSLPKAARPGVK